jgi:hypothetical protein
VGGLLGLCIGLSIITVIELVWVCLRLVRILRISFGRNLRKTPNRM